MCDRIATELPHNVSALNDCERLIKVLTDKNVFDRVYEPEQEWRLFGMLKTCGSYSALMKKYELALLGSWLDSYLPADVRVSRVPRRTVTKCDQTIETLDASRLVEDVLLFAAVSSRHNIIRLINVSYRVNCVVSHSM